MCLFALQVDLVGSEKLNNSMGFSMFFVGLGCLTGPPLAGEWMTSWKSFQELCMCGSISPKCTQTRPWVLHVLDESHDSVFLPNDMFPEIVRVSVWAMVHRAEDRKCVWWEGAGRERGDWQDDSPPASYFHPALNSWKYVKVYEHENSEHTEEKPVWRQCWSQGIVKIWICSEEPAHRGYWVKASE